MKNLLRIAVFMAALALMLPQAVAAQGDTAKSAATASQRALYEHLPNPIKEAAWKFVGTDYNNVSSDARGICSDQYQRLIAQEVQSAGGPTKADTVFAYLTKHDDSPFIEGFRKDAARLSKDLKTARAKSGANTPAWVPSRAPTLREMDLILRNAGCHTWASM